MAKPPTATTVFQNAARRNSAGAKTDSYIRPAGDATAVPDIVVYDTPSLRGFEQGAEEALFILAQSATGRRLMQNAIAADVGIVFLDENESDGATRGYVDWEQKIVFLARETDPRLLALTLGHELAHVSQFANGGVLLNVIEDHPLHALKKFLAIEADARAYEIKIALELEYPAPAEGNTRIRFDGMAQLAAHKTEISTLPDLAARIAPRLHDGSLSDDRIMAACFRAFYYDINLRATYENILMTRIEKLDDGILRAPQSFARETDSAAFLARLDGHDTPYMLKNREVTDIADPRLAAVSEKTLARVQHLAALRKATGAAVDDAQWRAPVYAPASAAAPAPAPKGPRA